MIKTALAILYKYLPALWELYKAYKEWEHEQNVKKIRKDPAKEWDKKFGDKPSLDSDAE